MSRSLVVLRSLVLASLLVTPSAAQSLGEAAKRQKEKRKGTAVKTYGDEELKTTPGRIANPADAGSASPAPSPSVPAAATPTSPSDSASPSPAPRDEAAERAEQEARWRTRAGPLLAAIARLEPRVRQLRAAAAAIERDVTMPYDNAGRAKLAATTEQLGAATAELDAARQAYAALEDEARRAGVPAGWIR